MYTYSEISLVVHFAPHLTLYCIVFCITMHHNAPHCNTYHIVFCTTMHFITLHCTMNHISLCSTTLHNTTLHMTLCTILHSAYTMFYYITGYSILKRSLAAKGALAHHLHRRTACKSKIAARGPKISNRNWKEVQQ